MFLGIISQCAPPPCTLSKMVFLSPSVWTRREYSWKLSWKESLLICFENFQGVLWSHRKRRNRMMNSFIIVNITPYVIDSLDDNSMLVHFTCPYHFTWALIWKKSLLLTALFWKLPGHSLFPHRQNIQRMVNTLLMVNINPICKR